MAGNSPSGDGRKLTKEMIKMDPDDVPTFENIFSGAISSPFDINIIRGNLNTWIPPVSSKQRIAVTPSLPLENNSKRKDDPSSISTSSVKVTGKCFDDNGSEYTQFKASRSTRSTRAETSKFYAYDSTGKRIEVLKRKPKQMSRCSFHEGDIGLYPFGQPCLDGQSTGLTETKTGDFSVKHYPVVIITKQFDAMIGVIISSSGGRGLSGKPESLRDRCIYVESMDKEPHQLGGSRFSSLLVQEGSRFKPKHGSHIDPLRTVQVLYNDLFEHIGALYPHSIEALKSIEHIVRHEADGTDHDSGLKDWIANKKASLAQKGDIRLSDQNLGSAGNISEVGAKTRHDSPEKKTASHAGEDAAKSPAESVRERIIGSTITSTRALQERITCSRKRRTSHMEDDSNLPESNLPKRRRMNDIGHIQSRYGGNYSGPGYALSQGTGFMAQRRFNGHNEANRGNYGGRSRGGSGRSMRVRQLDVYHPNSSISRVYRG